MSWKAETNSESESQTDRACEKGLKTRLTQLSHQKQVFRKQIRMIEREFWIYSLVYSKALALAKGFMFPNLKFNLAASC